MATRGGSKAASRLTTNSYVNVGLDVESERVLSTGCAVGGRFVGWLDVGLTTLSLVCPKAVSVNITVIALRQTERMSARFIKIKSYLLWWFGKGREKTSGGTAYL